MNLYHIVAVSQNGIIGSDNKLPWHISEDLKRFKRLTLNNTVLYGRKTYDSIGRLLPKRRNIIISRNSNLSIDGAEVYTSIANALKACKDSEEIFIIGGGEIYKQTLPLVSKIYLTLVHKSIKGDTFYPEIPPNFKLINCEKRECEETISFLDYVRTSTPI